MMNWPDSTAGILGCVCKAVIRLRFLRPALCLLLHLRVEGLLLERICAQQLRATWSEETLKKI